MEPPIPIVLKVNNFSGGISDDPREVSPNKFIISKHFDIFSQPNRLIPYRSLEADTNDGSTATGMKQYFVKDFLYASASAKLFGLGQNASGQTKIVYKADATTGNWTLPASSEGNGLVWNGCLIEFKDYLWGFQGTNQLWKWGTISSGQTITNSAATVGATITSVCNGVIASDDNLYMAYNNVVVRVNGASLTIQDAVLTLPTNLKITSICTYGNYIAIGCSPVASFNGKSKVFTWNLHSSDISETFDFGEGDLRVIETIEGMIVGITDRYLNNSTGAGKGSMVVQVYQGGTPQVIKEVFTQALTGTTISLSKAVKNNRLFFAAKIMTNSAGTEYNEGIWSFGRKNVNYPYTLSLDFIDENINTSGIQGFNVAGNYVFIAHSGDGSIDKTDDTAAYTFTSIYEAQIYDFGDVPSVKQLNSIKVSFAKLTSGQSVTVKLKVDDATSFTTVGTYNTVGGLSRTFVNMESTSLAFPSGKEFRCRIESVGGAEITGYELIALPLITP